MTAYMQSRTGWAYVYASCANLPNPRSGEYANLRHSQGVIGINLTEEVLALAKKLKK